MTAAPSSTESKTRSLISFVARHGFSKTRPEYEDSFGPPAKIKALASFWTIVGKAEQIWDDKLEDRIKDIILENSDSIYKGLNSLDDNEPDMRCWMMGSDVRHANPTVCIHAERKEVRRRIEKAIRTDGCLARHGFELKMFEDPELFLTGNNIATRLQPTILEIEGPSPSGNRSSLRIKSIYSNKTATIGGILTIDGVQYGLTAAHSLIERGKPPSKISSQMNASTVSTNANATPLNFEVNILCSSHTYADSQNLDKRRSDESGLAENDWALIEFHKRDLITLYQHVETHNYFEDQQSGLFNNIESFGAHEKSGLVYILTTRGIITGHMRKKVSTITFKHEGFKLKVWYISVDEEIIVGDSGSWVLDASTHRLLGTVVAASSLLMEAYAIPIMDIIDNIRRTTGSLQIELPEPVKVETIFEPTLSLDPILRYSPPLDNFFRPIAPSFKPGLLSSMDKEMDLEGTRFSATKDESVDQSISPSRVKRLKSFDTFETRPFSCSHCPKIFAQKRSVKRHYLEAHVRKLLDCPEEDCPRRGERGFARAETLRRHIANCHSTEIQSSSNVKLGKGNEKGLVLVQPKLRTSRSSELGSGDASERARELFRSQAQGMDIDIPESVLGMVSVHEGPVLGNEILSSEPGGNEEKFTEHWQLSEEGDDKRSTYHWQ